MNAKNILQLAAVLLAITISTFDLNAQSFKQGTITTIDGKEIKGLIKDNTFEKLSETVLFKTSKTAEATSYSPDMLNSYAFADGDAFQAAEVSYALNEDAPLQADKKFLRLVREGDINLYELRTSTKSPLFVQKGNGAIQTLGLGENNEAQYIETLKTLMADQSDVEVSDKLRLSTSSIIALVDTYNKTDQKVEVSSSYKPALIAWATAGVPYNRYKDGFKGISKGLYLESGMPIGGNMISATIGADMFRAEKIIPSTVIDEPQRVVESWFYTFTLRGQYTFFVDKKISPYVAAGANILKSNTNAVQLHTAVGANVNLGRHHLKVEVSDPSELNLKIGYGFSLIK